MVTIYGSYEPEYADKLESIANSLQVNAGFTDAALVRERPYRPIQAGEDDDVYNTEKSEHYVRISKVNVFVLYCKAHNESVMHELDYVSTTARHKLPCCYILKDIDCNMASLLKGTIKRAKMLVDEFDSSEKDTHDRLTRLISAKCLNFLYQKYSEL